MAIIEEKCEFFTGEDQAKHTTQTNGDKIEITGIHFTQGQAASMSWLVNVGLTKKLRWEVKVEGAD